MLFTHRFSDLHAFLKPNDDRALSLINRCAVATMNEFQDIVCSYGHSDEYRSFEMKIQYINYITIMFSLSNCINELLYHGILFKFRNFRPHPLRSKLSVNLSIHLTKDLKNVYTVAFEIYNS